MMPIGVTIIHGACQDARGRLCGADAIADDYAVINWCELETYPADWTRYGKPAGPIRNSQMLKEGRPTIVVAAPGGAGTADMVAKARKAGLEVVEVGH